MLRYIRQLAGESVIYGLAGAASALIQIFLIRVYTNPRYLSEAEYGALELVLTTMNVLTLVAVLALDSSAHRWFWNTDSEDDRRKTVSTWAWANFATTTFITLLVWLLAPWIAERISGEAAHASLYRIASLTLPLGVLGLVTTGWLRMRRNPKLAVGFMLGTTLLTVALILFFVLTLQRGALGVVWAQALAAVGITLAGMLLLRAAIAPSAFDLTRFKEMLHFALPLLPAGLAAWLVTASGRYFVQSYLGLDEVAVFSVGLRIATVAALVSTAFQTAWGPFALSIHQKAEAKQVYAAAMLWYLWASCVVATGLALFAPFLVRFLAPANYASYAPAEDVIGLLAFSFVFVGLKAVAAIGLNIVKDNRPIGLAVVISGALFILLSVLLLPRFGMVGAATATLVSQAFIPLCLFIRAQQVYRIPYQFTSALGILLVAAAVSIAGEFVGQQPPGIALRFLLLGVVIALAFWLRLRSRNSELISIG